jgi:membrane-associated protease RseP (regulator of RpoE activity)
VSDAPAPSALHGKRGLLLSVALFVLTFLSTSYVGAASWTNTTLPLREFWRGFPYSVPLMAILLAHELGHYIAARIHRVPASPPLFVPVPVQPLGTMGAVILMPNRIARRDALLDIGAAGPLAGLAVALPVLVYGLMHSPVRASAPGMVLQEGHSLLYVALLYLTKGPIPDGQDIQLSPTAFAGWAGLLVTMINLIPAAQLDGGHVAFALFGERQERYSRLVRALLLPLALCVSLYYGLSAWFHGATGGALSSQFAPGTQWLLWWLLLRMLARAGHREHPPTDDHVLSPRRKLVACFTLALFVLLFMPAWLREVPGG